MKRFVLGVAVLSMLACHTAPDTGPKRSPNWCPKCDEKRTYEIINLGGRPVKAGPNRRCVKCGYTWLCHGCRTDPFWRTK